VVAKNCTCLLWSINVVIFQLSIKIPRAKPTHRQLKKPTVPKYSGNKKSMWAPSLYKKEPLTTANNITQKNRST
jgi:hypothetical protein